LSPLAMDQILSVYKVNDLSERVRVFGTITYYQPGSAVVLQSGTKSLWIETQTRQPLRIGDIATAIGFPYAYDRVLSLVDGEIRDSGIQDPIPRIRRPGGNWPCGIRASQSDTNLIWFRLRVRSLPRFAERSKMSTSSQKVAGYSQPSIAIQGKPPLLQCGTCRSTQESG